MSLKFKKLREQKDKELMDSGLLSSDEFFGQEVAENEEFDKLAASVNALIEECHKSRESSQQQTDLYVAQLMKEKLEMQISRNLEDNVNPLIKIKQRLEVESNPGIVKVPKKL